MCFHPNKGFIIGRTSEGIYEIKFAGYAADYVRRLDDEKWSPEFGSPFPGDDFRKDFFELPCGKCLECRSNQARQWADRNFLEMLDYDQDKCWFVTLTYDEDRVPTDHFVDPQTGEVRIVHSLENDAISAFMKRLRKNTGQTIRFFGSAEYGSQSLRPHYHILIYGLELTDLVPFGKNAASQWYFTSKTISDAWQNRGHIIVAPMSYETIAYTSRYVVKKLGNFHKQYTDNGLLPPYVRMSRRPGIAGKFYNYNSDTWYDSTDHYFSTEKGGRVIYSIKYFDRMKKAEDPFFFDDVKADRLKSIQEQREAALSGTDLDYLDYLKVCETALEDRMIGLYRDLKNFNFSKKPY